MQTIKTEIGGNPYEVSLNTEFAEVMPLQGFPCFWSIGLQFHQLDEEGVPLQQEREELISLSNMMISSLRLAGDVAVIGITLYESVQELIFYSKMEDSQEIGNMINGFSDAFGESFKSRFLGAQAVEDTTWDRVAPYFDLWYSAIQQQREK